MPEVSRSSAPVRIALLGTYPPRRCGIATFTHDLGQALVVAGSSLRVIAVTDASASVELEEPVRYEIRRGARQDYARAAEQINYSDAQLICLQHEFGIYGGDDGSHLLAFLAQLRKPAIATLHTVLRAPSDARRSIVRGIAEHCDRVVVMSDGALDTLVDHHGLPASKIEVIPHGIPDFARGAQEPSKERLGVGGRRMLLTFGLLGPNKGIETVLRALPLLIARFPDLVYFVVGATHPNVRREQGESYRLSLEQEAEALGLTGHVVFLDRFVSAAELADLLRATDVYVTPYLNEAQSTSGTLSYAMGAGAAVVSTPYWHAREFLAEDRGRLFAFGDHDALAAVVDGLLSDSTELRRVRDAAWDFTRPMTWGRVGEAYVDLGERVLAERPRGLPATPRLERLPLPELRLDHLLRLTDDTGMIQHATYSVPARSTGYCVDDNARALIVATLARRVDDSPRTDGLITTYLSYLQLSQREDGHFRNFMSYARHIEPHSGSDDCAGRALWALGVCHGSAPEPGVRALAREMFERAMGRAEGFGLRGKAFAILGLGAFLDADPEHGAARRLLGLLSEDLLGRYGENADGSWLWFEPALTYDNAVVPFALLTAHRITEDPECLRVGLESLRFLEEICFRTDHLNLIGNEAWHSRDGRMSTSDEQPTDAAAFVLAFREAYYATSDQRHLGRMRESFEWFLGRNRLRLPVYDFGTGGCHDALGRHEVNQNQGAESTLAFLLSLLAMIDVVGLEGTGRHARTTMSQQITSRRATRRSPMSQHASTLRASTP